MIHNKVVRIIYLLAIFFTFFTPTKAQGQFVSSQELFPNQLKFQILYEDLGTKIKYYDDVKQHVSKYFKIVREDSGFGGKGKYIKLEDPTSKSENISILLHFNEYRYDKFIVTYDQDNYLDLFGATWSDEIKSSNLYRESSKSDNTLHHFTHNKNLEIKHRRHESDLTFRLEVIYTGYSVIHHNIASLDRGTVEPIKDNIQKLTFPENKDFYWMGNQLGRQDKLELYYDFLPLLDNIKENKNQISGTYIKDKTIEVIISRPSQNENWNSLKIISNQNSNEKSKFHLFKSTWEKECEYAKSTKEFNSINCQEEKHTFVFNEFRTIIHTKDASTESIETIVVSSKDEGYANKYYKKYRLPSSNKEILFKGRTNENGVPDGKILVKADPLLELTVKDGKVINDPKTPYELTISSLNRLYYRGELDPLTWEPKGEGKYKYEIRHGFGENATTSLLIYSGTFKDKLIPDLEKPMYIIMKGVGLPYNGTFKLIKPINLQLEKHFVYEGKAIFIPEEHENDRYSGDFAMVFDGRSLRTYPLGEHIHEHFKNGKWSIVDKSIYNFIYGTVKGENFYSDNATLKYDIEDWHVVLYPYNLNFDKTKADIIANSTYKNLISMDGKKEKVAGSKSSLSNKYLVGYFSKRTDLSGYEAINQFPDFKGFAYDINVLNKYRQNGHYFVTYILLDNFSSDQQLMITINKINSALYFGAKKYYGDNLKISKSIKYKKEDYSFKYDDSQVINYDYSGLKDQAKIRFRIYYNSKDNFIQYQITFSKD